MRGTFPLGLAFVLLASSAACAAPWNVDYAKSRIGFSVQWSNEPFSAVFRSWKANIDFDPADLAHARAVVTIDLASEASDEEDFDSGLKGPQGFQTAQFRTARFTSSRIVHKSGNNYVMTGDLSLHGVTRAVSLAFTLTLAGRTAHVAGTAQVLRSDFGIGQGAWGAPTPVAHEVRVSIDLAATRS